MGRGKAILVGKAAAAQKPRPLTKAEIERNRAALAAKIADCKPGKAIYAPLGVMDLREVGIMPAAQKDRKRMQTKAAANGTSGTATAATRKARPGAQKWSDDFIHTLHEEYMTGDKALAAVGKPHGISSGTLSVRFAKLGLSAKPRARQGEAVMTKSAPGAADPGITAGPEPAWLRPAVGDLADAFDGLMTPSPAAAGAGVITKASPGLAEVLAFLEQVQASGLPVTVGGRVSLRIEVELEEVAAG